MLVHCRVTPVKPHPHLFTQLDGKRETGEESVLSLNTTQRLQSGLESGSCCALSSRQARHLPVLKQHPATPKKFVNAALFLWLGLPSIIRHENGAPRKRSSNQSNLETLAFRFRVDGKYFENGASRRHWCHDNHVFSLTEFSPNTNPK